MMHGPINISSTTALGTGVFRRWLSGLDVKVATGTNLVLRVRVSGAIPPLSSMVSLCSEALICSVIGNINVVIARIWAAE